MVAVSIMSGKGAFAPGTRARRWRQSCAAEAAIFLALGVGILSFAWRNDFAIDGSIIAVIGLCSWMIIRALLSYRRGWKISYEIPRHARKHADRDDEFGRMAKATISKVEAEAKDPNRPRYAFDARLKRLP